MNTKRTILILMAVAAVSLFGALQASGYVLFTEVEGNCSQCHTTWPGAEHTIHTGFSCALCHTDEEPVPVNACATCHDPSDLLALHGPFEAPNNQYCGLCHEGVAAEDHSYSEIKALF